MSPRPTDRFGSRKAFHADYPLARGFERNVPACYRGELHVLLTSASVLGPAAYCLGQLRGLRALELLTLPVMFVFGSGARLGVDVGERRDGLVLRTDHSLAPLLNRRPVVRIGELSYGLYLWHLLALDVTRRAFAQLFVSDLYLFPVTLAVAYLMAEVSYRYWESFFLRLKTVSASPLGPALASAR